MPVRDDQDEGPWWQTDLRIALFGMLLVLPSLWAGLHWDDIPMAQNLLRWLGGTSEQRWWDLFNLDAPDPRRRFGGRVPWWSADDLFARFFRPVAAATHVLDYRLWPSSPMAMHAQSIAWFGGLVFVVVRFFRLLLPGRVATVAGAVYVTSYVHAVPVGWLSNRNAVIAGVFGFLACTAYVRWRSCDAPPFSWAPVLLLLSLLSAESGVSVLAFVVAYELTVGREDTKGRWGRLASMFSTVGLWRLAYSAAGFGAMGSGGYIDPVRSPGIFLHEAPGRLTSLCAFLLSPFRVLAAHGLPPQVAIGLACVFAVAAAVVLWVGVRREARIWSLSAGLCLLPLLAAAPGERLLTFAMAGLSPVVAMALLTLWKASHRGRAAAAAVVGLSFCVVSPGVLVLGSYDQSYDLRGIHGSFPTMAGVSDEDARGKNLFVLYSPGQVPVNTMRVSRERVGLVMPAFTWNLFPAETPGELTRVGCCTLEIGHDEGLSRGPFVVYFRGIDSPMRVGEIVSTLAFTAEVLKVDSLGVPMKMRFVLPEPLESPRNLFVTWNGDDFEQVPVEQL